MTDTGQIPGEGLPENAVGDAALRPHSDLPGTGVPGAPQPPAPGWAAEPQAEHGAPAYSFLDHPAAPGAGLDDEEDVLLMPGPQGTWSDPQPVPPQPSPLAPPVETHESGGRDSGALDYGAVRAQNPADAPSGPVPPLDALAAPAAAEQQAPAAPRRPLHMGPPITDTPSGGVSVRSLADRGPAQAPVPTPVRVPGPPTSGPEYLDVPPDGIHGIPAQQTGEQGEPAAPVPGSSWPAAPAASQQSLIPHADSVIPGQAAAEPVTAFPAAPVDLPVAAPVDLPVAEPVATPLDLPVAEPVATPVDLPVAEPVATPVDLPVAEPVATPLDLPVAEAVAGSPAEPVAVPVAGPDVEQGAEPAAARAAEPVAAPVAEPVAQPVASPVAESVVEQTAVPVAESVAVPPVEPVAGADPVAVPPPVQVPVQEAAQQAEQPEPAEQAEPPEQADEAEQSVQGPAQLPAQEPAAERTPAPDSAVPAPAPAPAQAQDPAAVAAAVEQPVESVADAVVPAAGPSVAEPVAAAPVEAAQPTPGAGAEGVQEVSGSAVPAAGTAEVAASAAAALPDAAVPVAEAAAPSAVVEPAPAEDAPAQHTGPEAVAVPAEPVAAVPEPAVAETPLTAPEPAAAGPAPDAVAEAVAAEGEAPGAGPEFAAAGLDLDTVAPAGRPVKHAARAHAAPAAAQEEPPAAQAPVEGEPENPVTVPQGGRAARRAEARAAAAESEPAEAYEPAVRDAVHRVIRERRDVRNGFRSDPIPHDVLLRVLEAAHTAPSVGHSQPWDFVVIRSEKTREKMHELATAQREAYAKSLPKGRARQFRELKIEAILDTPVNIVVTSDATRGGRHTLGRHTQPQMAPYSSALAVENLWLAARAEGLGVGWVSFFDERQMVAALGLPEHLEVVAYLCVGYVDEFPDEPELTTAGWSQRRPLSWVVHEEEYGNRALPGEEPHDLLEETLRGIRPLDAKALGEAWERQKRMTKPAGALGMLEIISAQLSGLSRQCPPPIPEPAAVAIFAGDHGVHAQGVTSWPQEVTAQMVANFLGGGAVCNAFANQVGAEVCVIDVGVASELPSTPGLVPRKVRPGTADFTTGPAMTREEALRAIEVGIETARDLVSAGNKALLTGEMGIANTTTSAALIAVYTGVDPAEVTGRGTGINDDMHARKIDVVRRALELHRPDPADPIAVLTAIGGLEHAAIVGLLLGAAALRTPVILDGVSAGAAALVARAIAPEVLAACIAGHRSAEPGHVAALTTLGLRPLVDLDLRLGEGTGALLALPLVQSAARVMHEVATFDAAGVTEKS